MLNGKRDRDEEVAGLLVRCPREEDSFPANLGKRLSGYEGGKNEEEGTKDDSSRWIGRDANCWLGQFGDWGPVVEAVDPW